MEVEQEEGEQKKEMEEEWKNLALQEQAQPEEEEGEDWKKERKEEE